MSAVWDLRLPPAQKLVLLKLADCADDDGGNAFPSLGMLSDACTLSRRTVQRTLADLETAGYLVVDAPATHRRPTTYRVVRWGVTTTPQGCHGDTPGVSSTTPRGVIHDAPGVSSTTHNMIHQGTHHQDPPGTTLVLEAEDAAQATPEAVVKLWNATATPPFTRVRLPLERTRRARLVAACAAVPNLADWATLVTWMNGQRWMRAPGSGPHPTWIATLDFVARQPGRLVGYVERATAGPVQAAPRTATEAERATRGANVTDVALGELDLVGGDS